MANRAAFVVWYFDFSVNYCLAPVGSRLRCSVWVFFFNTAVTVLAQLLLQVVIEKQQYHMRFL